VVSVRATAAVESVRLADGSAAVVVAALAEVDDVTVAAGAAALAESAAAGGAAVTALAESVEVVVEVDDEVVVVDAVDTLGVDCAVASANAPVSSTRLTLAALSAPRSELVSSVIASTGSCAARAIFIA
jgi:hypothetical protein